MAWNSTKRTAWLTIILSLGFIGTAPSDSAPDSTVPPASTGCQHVQCQQDDAATPIKGSPELWKFRRLTTR